jgi:tRNA(Ile)-lysidine synthase
VTTVNGLHSRLTTSIVTRQLFQPGDTLVIGLSGGVDSTVLLDLLATLPGYSLRLVAAHLNHCLRGADSDDDEQFCRDLAARYAIPFESRRIDVRAVAAGDSLNLEDAGRRTRFNLFGEAVTRWQAAGVVLAHHADDQAETVLMRLLRGSGTGGLAGMSWRNGRGHIRPLLDITRTEIETYAIERGLAWREDASNTDKGYLRNRIRHELLPLLQEYNPAVRDALVATADILSQEDNLLDQQARQVTEQACIFTADSATCDTGRLRSQPLALQRRIIRLMLSHVCGGLEQFHHRHIEDILHMPTSARPNIRLSLPRGLTAVRDYTSLTVRQAVEPCHEKQETTITGPGDYLLPDGSRLLVEAVSPVPATIGTSGTVCFDIDRVPFPWHVRTFCPGDRIQPLGMSGRKKVKDVYIDGKIPLARRAVTPLVFSGGELIWIPGICISHLTRVDPLSTRSVTCRLSA